MDLNVPPTTYNAAPASSPSVDLLASGIDSLVSWTIIFNVAFSKSYHLWPIFYYYEQNETFNIESTSDFNFKR